MMDGRNRGHLEQLLRSVPYTTIAPRRMTPHHDDSSGYRLR